MLSHYLTETEIDHAKSKGYGDNGLRYSLEFLNTVLPHSLTMEQMAEYVDAVTLAKVHSNDTQFLLPMLEPPLTPTVNLSVTGLGNLAYTALYMQDETCRKKAEALYSMLMMNGTVMPHKY
jgi:hypothetical protein